MGFLLDAFLGKPLNEIMFSDAASYCERIKTGIGYNNHKKFRKSFYTIMNFNRYFDLYIGSIRKK